MATEQRDRVISLVIYGLNRMHMEAEIWKSSWIFGLALLESVLTYRVQPIMKKGAHSHPCHLKIITLRLCRDIQNTCLIRFSLWYYNAHR